MGSSSKTGLKCLVTGGAGFVGQVLASQILSDSSVSQLILTDVSKPPVPKDAEADQRLKRFPADLTNLSTIQSIFESSIDCIYLLHGIMSSQAESNFDLGLNVNIDSIRLIFDHLRATNPGVKVVFTSSTAVYGPPSDTSLALSESVAPDPQSSYGAQKHVIETLLNDYSRRSLVDGRIVRLPTVSFYSERTLRWISDGHR